MTRYLGLDTSNYTTSVAALEAETGALWQVKQPLPVREGELGLRQSDAGFHHVRQRPELVERLVSESGSLSAVAAIGVSTRPSQAENSYMPCFLSGEGAARQLAAVLGVPLYRFSHQQGHVMAALYGAEALELNDRPVLAFHVSGGTTDALLVRPSAESVIHCECVASSLDLKAGQLVDRVGGMLGLPFPAGPALEALAGEIQGKAPRPSMEGTSCHLSGVENQCRRLLESGASQQEVAQFCLLSIRGVIEAMTARLLAHYGDLPVVYAGGVMSNGYLRRVLSQRFDGRFAPPAYSADNAAGIAVLTCLQAGGALA